MISPLGRRWVPSMAILIRSTPSLACLRICAMASLRLVTSAAVKYSGAPTRLGNQSLRLCRLVITRLLAAMRGPSNSPALTVLRTAMLSWPLSPGQTIEVTPAASTCWAKNSPRKARNSSLVQISMSSSLWALPNARWVCTSTSPGMTKCPLTSRSPGRGGGASRVGPTWRITPPSMISVCNGRACRPVPSNRVEQCRCRAGMDEISSSCCVATG